MRFFLALALPLITAAGAAELFDETKVTTIFAFDDHSIPHTQNLRLEMNRPERQERVRRR